METKRQQKFSRLIQKELSDMFQKEGSVFLDGAFITVTKVRVTTDLSLARVYVSFFNRGEATQALNSLKSQAREVRYKMGTRIKDQVRAIPALEFYLDDTNEYIDRMDKIFDQLNKKKE